jgi:hypothetical protein
VKSGRQRKWTKIEKEKEKERMGIVEQLSKAGDSKQNIVFGAYYEGVNLDSGENCPLF